MPTVKFVDLGKQYLSLRQEILDKFDEISTSGDYILSNEVREFEKNFAMYCGTTHAVGVGNGSDALYLSLLSLGVGPDDEVITAPNSFVATAWVIARTGARMVFCDVCDDMNINPDLIESVISERTKVILPVHLTGRVADMDRIQSIADKHNLFVVEDAAQAIDSFYKGKPLGSIGHLSAFSFHPVKHIACGEGGMLTTNSEEIYKKLSLLRTHGITKENMKENHGGWFYEMQELGFNYRLTDFQSALGITQLAKNNTGVLKRNKISNIMFLWSRSI